jgi:hypothetical protein
MRVVLPLLLHALSPYHIQLSQLHEAIAVVTKVLDDIRSSSVQWRSRNKSTRATT